MTEQLTLNLCGGGSGNGWRKLPLFAASMNRMPRRQTNLPLYGGGSGSGYRALPLFRAANDCAANDSYASSHESGNRFATGIETDPRGLALSRKHGV